MQKYNYKAKTSYGKAVTGLVEARSEKDALKLLHEKNLIVFSLREKTKVSPLVILDKFRKVSSKDITQLTRQLSTMIHAGLTLSSALNILKEQAKPKMAKILTGVLRKVEGGSSFHEALSTYPSVFSKIYLSLVRSGETAGKLDQVLEELAESLEKQDAFKRKVKGALIYPSLIITGMIIVAFIMMIYVVPKLTDMYEEMETDLPLPTQILISVSTFMARFWYLIILAVGGLVYGFMHWRKTPLGRDIFDRSVLKIPIIGNLITKVVLTQVTGTLSMLISAGVPIIEALKIVAEAANNVIFERSIQEAAKGVEKGLPLTSVLEKFEEYPAVVIQMISVGEQTGKVGEVLSKVADYFEQESEAAIKALTTAIEPLMMVILGIGVGFIVISVITPIYNLTSQF